MILAAPARPSAANSSRARAIPSEIDFPPLALIWSIPAYSSVSSYDHNTRAVA